LPYYFEEACRRGCLLSCSMKAHNTQIDAEQSYFEFRAVKKEK
jgi:hypothetical protein